MLGVLSFDGRVTYVTYVTKMAVMAQLPQVHPAKTEIGGGDNKKVTSIFNPQFQRLD